MFHNTVNFVRRAASQYNTTGAVLPSSPFLGQAVARAVAHLEDCPIVELGAGTGALSRFLADKNPMLIEIDPRMAEHLALRFPHCEVLARCAMEYLRQLRHRSGLVISLPLINNPFRSAIIASLKNAHGRGMIGWCVIYTYGPNSPLADVGFGYSRRYKKVLMNVPPATVWIYR